ncbi:heat shock 70 kDa protein 14 isoform X3 [Salvelinus namaycush]|uniref:Heat shock 70 kDa protein 14 isoform X3 n=1 Tax=Salvelinus namaycush TaxID=8040 RepID=A0A8U0U605_SALNM|nr:heat shock 70 kDa protein 14 isoform X3 [Salvelinus namaycush]XP_038840681.1 heat shock 70 kDa protein 14 isoform X3 [Salvelinus namaycush]
MCLSDASTGSQRGDMGEGIPLHLIGFKCVCRSFKQDVSSNARAMMKLMNGADMAKHSLSTLGSANCFVDSLHDGRDFDCNISRARFELLCSSLFNKSVQPIRSLLETTGLSTSDINKVVLCGGSARIPRLQQMIKDLFADVELLSSAPPDEVIAVGAAMEAGLLVGREIGSSPESVIVEACVSDILLKEVDETGAEVFSVLLPSGTPLPARRHHILSGPGRLASLCLELYQKTTEQPERLAKSQFITTQLTVPVPPRYGKPRGALPVLSPQSYSRVGSNIDCSERPGDQRGQP